MGEHRSFTPSDREEINDFFRAHNYAVISDALTADELHFLNQFVDDSQRQIPAEWGIGHADIYSHGQILVNHPELDHYARHPVTLPLVKAILGPDLRFSQIDFRDVPAGIGEKASLHFHRDRGFVPKEYWWEKRRECVYVCAIYHTRQLGANDAGRRTLHHYFSREGNPSLTNWALVPQRLAQHTDAETKAYYSHWTEKMQAYVDAGFSEEFYREQCGGKKG